MILFVSRLADISGISPEAMVAGLSVLTRLETLHIHPYFSIEQRTRHPPPSPADLPAFTTFDFRGSTEYLEVLLALLDAPQLGDIRMYLYHSLHFPQLSPFIARTKSLRFRHAQVKFKDSESDIQTRSI